MQTTAAIITIFCASGMLVDKAREIWKEHIARAATFDPAAEVSNIFYGTNDAICKYIRQEYADQSPQASECMGTTAVGAGTTTVDISRLAQGVYFVRFNGHGAVRKLVVR